MSTTNNIMKFFQFYWLLNHRQTSQRHLSYDKQKWKKSDSNFQTFCFGVYKTNGSYAEPPWDKRPWSYKECLGCCFTRSTWSRDVREAMPVWSWCPWAHSSWARWASARRSPWRAWSRPRARCSGRASCAGPCLTWRWTRREFRVCPRTRRRWDPVERAARLPCSDLRQAKQEKNTNRWNRHKI